MAATNSSSPIGLLIGLGIVGIALVSVTSSNPPTSAPPVQVAAIGAGIPPEGKGVREIHWATGPGRCEKMKQRFKNEGRNVEYRGYVRNPFGSGNFQLRVGCVFEGPDADPNHYATYNSNERANEWLTP